MARLLTKKTVRIWNQIVAKAWDDPEFKKRLQADPAGVMREHGIEVPKALQIRLTEDENEACLTIFLAKGPDEDMRTEDDDGPIQMTWSTW